MCVIMLADADVRPTDEMIRLGFQKNPAGAGAAWREDGKVHWMKGLKLNEVQELNKWLPFPYTLHFRNPSANTATGPGACHPFPVDDDVSVELKGATDKAVLFHNGFWTDWRNKLLETAIKGYAFLPTGGWTDSRGLAWMAAHIGPGVLEMINEKVVLFGMEDILVFGDGWSRVNDVWVSNTHWKDYGGGNSHRTGFYYTTPPASMTSGKDTDTTGTASQSERGGGASQGDTFRGTGSTPSGTEAQQERVQTEGSGTGGSGVAEQRSEETTWRPGEEAAKIVARNFQCQDCKDAGRESRAQVWANNYGRCWPCWRDRQAKMGVMHTGEAFVQGAKGDELVHVDGRSKCGFCNTYWTHHRILGGMDKDKPVCSTCWLKLGRPSIRTATSTGETYLHNRDAKAGEKTVAADVVPGVV